jgi:hypothetical protein
MWGIRPEFKVSLAIRGGGKGRGNFFFQFPEIRAFDDIAVSFRKARIVLETIIGGKNDNRQIGDVSLNVVQHIPSVGLPQKKIEKNQIGLKGPQVSFCSKGIAYGLDRIPFVHEYLCNEFSNALLVIYD